MQDEGSETPPAGQLGDAPDGRLADRYRELAERASELEETVRRQEEVLAMVAHDLRNPLGSVAGFAELLRRQLDGSLDASSRTMLERIDRLSRHMLRLVDDLLDVTVLDSGHLHLDVDQVEVTAAVREAVDAYRLAAARKGITIDLLADGEIRAELDPARLAQVLDNLLSNAIKFSPNQAGATITVTCTRDDGAVRLTVADEGVGIPEEQQERLFEPFGAQRQPGTADERSVGLGLAITRSIIDAHGGEITVDSARGHGSVFEVCVPLRPSADG